MESSISNRWRFSLDTENVSLKNLSWQEAEIAARTSTSGDLAAQTEDVCVSLEFNSTHAAVLYMGPDKIILRPYLPQRTPESQDLGPFFCKCCGVLLGPQEEYLARFLTRAEGFQLFLSILQNQSLPTSLPSAESEETEFGLAADQILVWRPIPVGEGQHPN